MINIWSKIITQPSYIIECFCVVINGRWPKFHQVNMPLWHTALPYWATLHKLPMVEVGGVKKATI